MSIPTAEELDAWMETLRGGYASKEMLPRVIAGYRRLLEVAEAAGKAVEAGSSMERHEAEKKLRHALDALVEPTP